MSDVPERICPVCGEFATYKRAGAFYCDKHGRFKQMRAKANYNGKKVPSEHELESMVPDDMRCQDCGRVMNWLIRDGNASVVTLQHYRDGSLALVCKSCNSRHRDMPGDSYRDMPKDHKMCSECKEIKHSSDFYPNHSHRTGVLRRSSHCKECDKKRRAKWRNRNREKDNETARRCHARLRKERSEK